MSISSINPRINRLRDSLIFSLGFIMYLLGIYTSLFGGARLIIPLLLILSTIIFSSYFLYVRLTWRRIVVDEGLTLLTQELLTLLQDHIQAERKAKLQLGKTLEILDYTPLKLLLQNILLDTEKHEKLLKAMIDELTKEQAIPNLEEYREEISKARGTFQRHLMMEARIMRMIKEESKRTKSRLVRTLLQLILEEERLHHETFKLLLST